MVLHITCDEVVAQCGGSASLNNAQGQTTKKLLAYTTYTTQPKITKKRIKLRKSPPKKKPLPLQTYSILLFSKFFATSKFFIFYFLFFPGCGIFLFFTHLEHKLIKRRAPVFLHGKLGASRVMNK